LTLCVTSKHSVRTTLDAVQRIGLAGGIMVAARAGFVRRALAMIIAAMLIAPAGGTVAQTSNEMYFDLVWARTDGPIATGNASRSWVWGPTKYGAARMEAYAESPGGERLVQYFDKSRMEITHPGENPNSDWYVTNGLLVVELITGRMQVGDAEFEEREPAQVNVAGDNDDPNGPTYATFQTLLDAPATPEGWIITNKVDRAGNVVMDDAYAAYNITIADIDEVTGHAIAKPFLDFANSTGIIWANSAYVTGTLFPNPLFALGRPITEPYWAEVKVAGTERDVLLQCFERRCVTYTPGNPEGWTVEAGNVGRHYFNWRYSGSGPEEPQKPVEVFTCNDFEYQDDAQHVYDLYKDSDQVDVTALVDDEGLICSELDSRPGGASCHDFLYQEDAQAYFEEFGGSPSNNVDGLDLDGDGIACEELPSRPETPGTPPPSPPGGGGGGGGGSQPPPPSR
jgi:hypothetical protein